MDRIVTCGFVKKIDGHYYLCDLKDQQGFTKDFPIHKSAFQVPPMVDDRIAFMTWETRDVPGFIQIHQSACAIPQNRYDELVKMSFADVEQALIQKEFYTRSLITP